MDNELSSHVTFRKPQRTSSLNDLTINNNNSTLFDTTMLSLPNSSMEESNTITKELQNRIENIQKELDSAHQEIENLNIENKNLKQEIIKCNKVIDLYKKVSVSDCKTPKSEKKKREKRIDTLIKSATQTTITPRKTNIVCVEQKIAGETQDDIIIVEQKQISNNKINDNEDAKIRLISINKDDLNKKTVNESQHVKRKIVILADEQGRNMQRILQKFVGNEYIVTCIWKSGARFQNILTIPESIVSLNNDDFIIVLGGINDTNPFDIESTVNRWLSQIPKTNIIFCETPYNKYLNEKKLNYDLKFLSSKYKHVCFLNMNYSRYIPKRKYFALYTCRMVLREILKIDYAYKLGNYRSFINNIQYVEKIDKNIQTDSVHYIDTLGNEPHTTEDINKSTQNNKFFHV